MTGLAATAPLAHVRRAAADDRGALTLMFDRCTVMTRYRRFHAPVRTIPERYLADALAGRPFHYALVACPAPDGGLLSAESKAPVPATGEGEGPGQVVALASCRLITEGAAEVGILVEDAWQRRGLGTRLLASLVTHARRIGVRALEAQLLAEQAWITGILRQHGTCRLRSTSNGVLNVTLRLGEESAQASPAPSPR